MTMPQLLSKIHGQQCYYIVSYKRVAGYRSRTIYNYFLDKNKADDYYSKLENMVVFRALETIQLPNWD